MFDALDSLTQRVAPADARWTLRAVDELSETLTVRQDVAEAPQRCRDTGVMVSVSRDGGLGHAATADLSEAGLADAFDRAGRMARAVAGRMVFDPADLPAVTARAATRVWCGARCWPWAWASAWRCCARCARRPAATAASSIAWPAC
nr:DNA gyrase modulator [Piscinibacter sp.]